MLKQQARTIAALLYAADLSVTLATLPVAYALRSELLPRLFNRLTPLYEFNLYLVLVAPTVLIFSGLLFLEGAYRSHRTLRLKDEVALMTRASFFGSLLLALVVFGARWDFISRPFLAIFFVVNILFLVAERVTVRLVARRVRSLGFNFRTVVLVGDTPRAASMARLIREHPWWGLKLLGLVREKPAEDGQTTTANGVPLLGSLQDFPKILTEFTVDEVVLAVDRGEDHLVDREFREDLREVLQRAEKRHSVRGRRLAVLGGFLAHEAEELQTPPGVLADEPGHRRGARRVAHEDDRAEVEPQRAHAPGHEADRHPLGDEEEDIHDEEDGQERARDEVPPRAEHDEREEEASEEGRARHERDFILQAQRAVAAIRALEEQETRENEDRGRDEHEIEVEFVERREPVEETGKKLAAKRVGHGQRRERDAEVGRVQESGDRPGLLLQHSEPGAIPLPPGC